MHRIGIIETGDTLTRWLAATLDQPPRPLGPEGGQAELVVAAPGAVLPPGQVRCRILLLPGPLASQAGRVRAGWVVSYGLSRRDTLTLSSFAPRRPCLTLQRELVTLTGTCLEPQELPLFSSAPSPLLLLAWAGTCLLAGADPEALGKKPCPFPGKPL